MKVLNILGSKSFQKKIKRSIKILETKSYDDYKIIKEYVSKILTFKSPVYGGLVDPSNDPHTIFVDSSYYKMSIKLLISVIVHEAYHLKLYYDNNGEIPMTTFDEEQLCLEHQIRILQTLKASKKDIDNPISVRGTVWWEE